VAAARSISGIEPTQELAARRPTSFDLFAPPGNAPLGADWPTATRFSPPAVLRKNF